MNQIVELAKARHQIATCPACEESIMATISFNGEIKNLVGNELEVIAKVVGCQVEPHSCRPAPTPRTYGARVPPSAGSGGYDPAPTPRTYGEPRPDL